MYLHCLATMEIGSQPGALLGAKTVAYKPMGDVTVATSTSFIQSMVLLDFVSVLAHTKVSPLLCCKYLLMGDYKQPIFSVKLAWHQRAAKVQV